MLRSKFNHDAEVKELCVERNRYKPNVGIANEMEVLTERQRQIQSRKPLYREYSSVFPITQKCRATRRKSELEWKRMEGGHSKGKERGRGNVSRRKTRQ